MYRKRLVVRTKLTPPRLHKRVLNRPRVTYRLLEALDYRLTVVQAGAGFGKSSALVPYGIVGTWKLRGFQWRKGWQRLIGTLTGRSGESPD